MSMQEKEGEENRPAGSGELFKEPSLLGHELHI